MEQKSESERITELEKKLRDMDFELKNLRLHVDARDKSIYQELLLLIRKIEARL